MAIDKSDFEKTINIFASNIKEDGRYKSWEHCKHYFDGLFSLEDIKNENKYEKEKDLACLHLAFYLASWGMYRGSAFILQYDYKKHKNAVSILLNGKYSELRKGYNKKLLGELIKELRTCYYTQEEEGEDDEASITLITKIIMGTMGCVPAFDRYFIQGLKEKGFYKRGAANDPCVIYDDLVAWCEDENLFENVNYKYYGKPYPKMKIIDMYFWEVGYDKDCLDWLQNEAESMLKSPKTCNRAKRKINRLSDYFTAKEAPSKEDSSTKVLADIIKAIDDLDVSKYS